MSPLLNAAMAFDDAMHLKENNLPNRLLALEAALRAAGIPEPQLTGERSTCPCSDSTLCGFD